MATTTQHLPTAGALMPESIAARLPTFVIIGAMRCGTTSLHAWLRGLPGVSVSSRKELSFFVSGRHGSWERGLEWYADWFDPAAPVRGESSPKYTKDPTFPGVAERMLSVLPDARLLYLVRDPIARLVSHFSVIRLKGWERRTLAEALRDLDDRNKYVVPGRYFHQLSRYRDCFPDDRIKVVALEDLQRDPQSGLRDICAYLGIELAADSGLELPRVNVSGAKRAMTPVGRAVGRLGRRTLRLWGRVPIVSRAVYEPMQRSVLDEVLRQRLVELYADDVAALRAHTGHAFPDWSI